VDEVGKVITTPHMPGWRDFPLSEVLVERLGLPTYLDNESRIQAIAEGWFGLGRGIDNFVCLEAGVGISAGIVINGELWRGVHSLAGEIGHTSMSGDGERCYCDNRGCWEMTASSNHLLNSVKTSSIARSDEVLYQDAELTMERVVTAADAGDQVALREIEQHADALAGGICNLILAYDPERIIVHGESILLGERLMEMLRKRVAERFSLWLDYEAPIMLSELGTDAGLAGAAGLALHGAWGLRDPTARMGSTLAR
jgi:predicted NBD/HSP70 family sugar kinase